MQNIDQCVACGDGAIIDDPMTGDARCQNCGARPDFDLPLVGGGQGRAQDGEDARAFACAVAIVATLVGVVWYFATHLPGHQP